MGVIALSLISEAVSSESINAIIALTMAWLSNSSGVITNVTVLVNFIEQIVNRFNLKEDDKRDVITIVLHRIIQSKHKSLSEKIIEDIKKFKYKKRTWWGRKIIYGFLIGYAITSGVITILIELNRKNTTIPT